MRRWFAALLPFSLGCLLAVPAAAQPASLVRDIDPSPQPSDAPLEQLVAVGPRVFFTLSDRSGDPRSVWATDGTASGTEQLLDDCGGQCERLPFLLGGAGGLLYFETRLESGDGIELWRSDGTRRGTLALTRAPFQFLPVVPLGRLTLFLACSAIDACELWRTDGSPAGTRPVAGPGPSPDFQPVAFGGRVYYFGRDTDELWASDGTAAGTALVRAFPGLGPYSITAAAGRLFLPFHAGGGKLALWASDGTAAGSHELGRFVDLSAQPPYNLRPPRLEPYAGGVRFIAEDGAHGEEIWQSDGTAAGTRRITALADATAFLDLYGFDASISENLADLGGHVVLAARDGASGPRLWSTNGAPGSTVAVTPAGVELDGGSPYLVAVGSRAVFAADTGRARGLWSSDGTAAGTFKLLDLCDLCFGPRKQTFLGKAVFEASDPVHGIELWTTDGTPQGTRRFTDLPAAASQVGDIAALGGGLVFAARDGLEAGLWTSDGTAGGTRELAGPGDDGASSHPRPLAALAGRLLFSACDGSASEVWATAGADAAPVLSPGAGPDFCSDLAERPPAAVVGSSVVFWTRFALWASDGRSVTRLGDFPWLDVPPPLVPFAGEVFFLVGRNGAGDEIWQSDGTVAGTRRAVELAPVAGTASSLTAIGGALYFATGAGLWVSDGTPAGTRRFLDRPGVEPSFGLVPSAGRRSSSAPVPPPAPTTSGPPMAPPRGRGPSPPSRSRSTGSSPSPGRAPCSGGTSTSSCAARTAGSPSGGRTAPRRAPHRWRTSCGSPPSSPPS